MNTTTFMEKVLPADGAYCIVGLKEGSNPRTFFYRDIPGAVAKAEELSGQSYNAYFACASFEEESGGRKTTNAHALQSFYVDIDCGVGKPYAAQADGLEALSVFCKAKGLPTPTIVSSGYGIHAYWIASRSMTRSEWKPTAERLKTLCREEGLRIDMSVTADAARILRVPGTFNYKRDPVPVEILLEGEEFELADFTRLLGVTILLSEPPDYLRTGPSELMKSLSDDRQKRFVLIMERSARGDGCQQLVYIATEQEKIGYDLWRAGLSIARNCTDFEVGIHAISDKHPSYDFETTIRKSEDLIDKPYKCETIESHNPGGCKGCPHKKKIKSPIVLGVEVQTSEEEVIVEIEEGGDPVEYEIPTLPKPYFRAKSGAIYVANGDDEPELVYEHSLYLVKRMTDSVRGDLALARLHLPREKAREFIVPLYAMTSKDELRKVLSANGVISAGKALERLMWYLISCAKTQQVTMDTEILHAQMGWAEGDSKFILGTQEIGVSEIRYSPPSETTESVATLLHAKGSLVEWKRVTKTYAAPGAEGFALPFFGGFGSPLIKFTGYNGAMFALVSPNSGTGKTTIMRMVNSIWGHPSKLLSVEADTYAHKIYRAGVLNNLPLTVDEVTNMPMDVASKLVYAIPHGMGPGRMQSQVNMERKNDTTWSLIGLCTSNASIVDKLSSGKSTANGELMRLIEYRVESLNLMSKTEAYELFEVTLMENYGVAGTLYAEWVVRNKDEVIRRIRAMQEYIDKRAKLDNRERYWSACFAACIVGGQIAYELGLHEIPVEPVLEWIFSHLIPSLRRDVANAVPEIADVLGDFLNAHRDSVLVINNSTDGRSALAPLAIHSPHKNLSIRFEPDVKKLYISTKVFKDFCTERQVMVKDLLGSFKDKGAYLGEQKKRMGKGTNIDSPAVRVYEFSYNGEDFYGIEGAPPEAR